VARVVIGTRGSPLALWQARHVAARLKDEHPGLEIEERIIKTEGDVRTQVSLASLGGTGVFVRKIEDALLAGEVDLAVHSLKDLPTEQPDGLVIAAVPERHDPRDALLSVTGMTFDELPPGSDVATGSFRRRCQLLHARQDLNVVPVRGNVDTRIKKLKQGDFAVLVLALAGVQRLGIDNIEIRPIPVTTCLPAVGQGALGLETREDDTSTREIVACLNHVPSHTAVSAERAFLRRLGGGCLAPATAFARIEMEVLRVEAVVGEPDGDGLLMERENGAPEDGLAIGSRLAKRLLAAGADRILDSMREDDSGDHGAG